MEASSRQTDPPEPPRPGRRGAAASAGAAAPRPGRGRRLGKYRLIRILGRGGMGIVYEAEDPLLRRRVALKVLPARVGWNLEARKRFFREARLAASLSSPQVIVIHEVGQHGARLFLAMEIAPGGSAHDYLRRCGPIPWRAATRIVADVCRGLAAAHDAGLIHRDIKPSNILLTAPLETALAAGALATEGVAAKLADFGLSRSADPEADMLTGPDQCLGTPHFMSPEQCRREPLDGRSDLYALGAAYYTLLTGRFPYDAEQPLQVLFAHCSAPPPDPRSVDPALPEACSRIVARCMAKEPPDRYDAARRMLADLERLLEQDGQPAAADNPLRLSTGREEADARSARSRGVRGRRRSLAVVGLGIVVAAVLAVWAAMGDLATKPQENRQVRRGVTPSLVATPSLVTNSLVTKPATTKVTSLPVLDQAGPLMHVIPVGGSLGSFAVGREGRLFAWGGATGDREEGVVEVRSGLAAVPVFRFQGDERYSEIKTLALAPHGRAIAFGLVTEVLLGELASGRVHRLARFDDGNPRCIAFSPDGNCLAVAVERWHATTGEVLLYRLRMTPAGAKAVYERRIHPEHTGLVRGIVFSPDGQWIATCDSRRQVVISRVEARDSPRVLTLPGGGESHDFYGFSLAFSPDSREVAVGGETSVMLADPRSGQWRAFPRLHLYPITGLAYSDDGKMLASGCRHSIRLWDVATGRPLGPAMEGHDSNCLVGVGFLADPPRLISAAYDRTLHVWDWSWSPAASSRGNSE